MNGVTINKILYNLPSTWEEVTYKQWTEMQARTNLNWRAVLSILTGINSELVEQITDKSMLELLPLIKWLENKIDLQALPLPVTITHEGSAHVLPKKIAEQTFGQKIIAHQYLQKANAQEAIPFIVAVYLLPIIKKEKFNPDCIEEITKLAQALEGAPLLQVYAAGNNYLIELMELIKREEVQLARAPKSDHLRAGVKMFEKFGALNSIDTLAGGDILKYTAVQQIEYNVAFMKLLLLHHTAVFQENLQSILKTK